MKSEGRPYGHNITALLYHDRGVALVIISPTASGQPDTSEEFGAAWIDMVSDLAREGYVVGPTLEPEHTMTLPLAPQQTGMLSGSWYIHTVYKKFDHYSLDLIGVGSTW